MLVTKVWSQYITNRDVYVVGHLYIVDRKLLKKKLLHIKPEGKNIVCKGQNVYFVYM
jgi:hypothetical protein